MNQPSLFDAAEAAKLRDDAIALVSVNAGTFVADMRSIAILVSQSRGQVTSDDLRRIAQARGVEPHHPNAWGAIFRGRGWECVGRRKSVKVSNHAREIRIWKWSEP